MSKILTAVGYLVLVPDTYKYNNQTYVRDIRIDRYRATKPALEPGELVIKVRLNFNEEDLKESIPVVDINVTSFSASPIPAVIVEPVEV